MLKYQNILDLKSEGFLEESGDGYIASNGYIIEAYNFGWVKVERIIPDESDIFYHLGDSLEENLEYVRILQIMKEF